MKVREVIPHSDSICIVIALKLFLDLQRDSVFPRGLTDSQSYVPNGELPTDAVITNTSNQSLLLLPKTAKSMEGWYQCIAKNEAGEQSSNSTLHVLGLLFLCYEFCLQFRSRVK